MKITVSNNKGGVGKTILSVILSQISVASNHFSTLLVDVDGQGNASSALLDEKRKNVFEKIDVLQTPGRTPKIEIFDNYSNVIFDTPPSQESVVVRKIIEMSDIILCPVILYPNAYEGYQTIAALAGAKAKIVVIGTPKTTLHREMLSFIKQNDKPFAILPTSETIVKNIANQYPWNFGLRDSVKKPYLKLWEDIENEKH